MWALLFSSSGLCLLAVLSVHHPYPAACMVSFKRICCLCILYMATLTGFVSCFWLIESVCLHCLDFLCLLAKDGGFIIPFHKTDTPWQHQFLGPHKAPLFFYPMFFSLLWHQLFPEVYPGAKPPRLVRMPTPQQNLPSRLLLIKNPFLLVRFVLFCQ
jgi:hypothetical protein